MIKSFLKLLSSRYQTIHLEYKVNVKPRWGHGKPPHGLLYDKINKNRASYIENLQLISQYSDVFRQIKDSSAETNEDQPSWNNGFLPGLDIVGLYGMIAKYRPKRYIEIGSGNSTKVARKAVNDLGLKTEITSIDPFPRANIDHLADKVIRTPFEDLENNRFIVDALEENDILFIDNSHRSFSNSDVTICFLELLPLLKKGVLVHVHDIYLPYDYPQFMCDRFYNEQYVLAGFILAGSERYMPVLPNYFISEDKDLKNILTPLWNSNELKGVETHGGSFWFQIV